MFFLIVGLIPHVNELLPYKLCLIFPEANAAEEQAPEAQADKAPEIVEGEVADQEVPLSEESVSSLSATSITLAGGVSSQSVAPLAISFNADDFTGAAHLNYPILVPPGRDGLVTNLSFIYNNSSPNGWIGVGWNIPVGFIERRGPRKGVPKYDSSDVFVLNLWGSPQELVSIGGGEYRLRIEGPNYKIQYNSSNDYWEVWDKAGVKMRFGSTPDSRIDRQTYGSGTFRWCIDRVDDPKTNYMEFVYQKDLDGSYVNQLYLQKIQYNGQVSGNLPHNHEIIFNLESSNRPDPIYNYRGGFKTLTRKRLSFVEVRTEGNLVRKYQLQYAVSNVKSLLSSITVYGSDNASTLPPTTFTYQTHTLGFQQQGTLWSNPAALDGIYGNYMLNRQLSSPSLGTQTDVIDMNGDALPDKVFYDRTFPYDTWNVYLNNGTGFNTAMNWSVPVEGNYIRYNFISSGVDYGSQTDVVDMNGDGLPDQVQYDKTSPYDTWSVFRNTGSGFEGTSIPWLNKSARNLTEGNLIQNTGVTSDLFDMNGDGLLDRVRTNNSCSYPYDNCPWSVYLNNGTGFDASPISWPNPSAWGPAAGNYIQCSDTKGLVAGVIDMNGDGLPDRVVYSRSCVYPYTNCPWKVYFNNGNGFDPGVDWSNPSPWQDSTRGNYIRNTDSYGVFTDVIDINGDGLPDRVVYNRNCLYPYTNCPWKVYFNNGTGFGAGVDWPNPSAWNPTSGNHIRNSNTYGIYTDVIDIDGNGLPDRVVYDRTSPYTQWSIYYNKGPVPDLLSKVENGIGGTTEITYLPSTAYEDESGNKVNQIPFVVQTVRSYTQKDGRDNSYLYRYFYSDASFDPAEVEFSGFGKVTAYQMFDDEAYESKTDTSFHQDYYRKGKIQTQTILSSPPAGFTDGHKKETVNTWLLADTQGGGKFPYLRTATTTVTDQEVGGPYAFSQTTRNEYDIRPGDQSNQTFNLLQGHKNEGWADEIETYYEYTDCRTTWILSKPTKVTVKDGSGVIATRKWMGYNCATGNIETEEICKSDNPSTGCASPNSGQNVITSYQYDPTYKTLSQVTDPMGYPTTFTYDSTKTFVYETTNPLGHETTTEYDPGTGNLKKLILPHLQSTSYWHQTKYDVFGRKILERLKDNPGPDSDPIVDRGSTSYLYNNFNNPNAQNIEKVEHIVVEGDPTRTLDYHSSTYFDGMGRTYWVSSSGPDGKSIVTETIFDEVGRVWKKSNPFYCYQSSCDPRYYTTNTYDGLSRVVDVEIPDTPYQHISTTYQGLKKIVTNQRGYSRAYTYDLNQRLKKVEEDYDPASGSRYSSTEYTYDALGNLTQVVAAKSGTGCPEPQGCPEKNTTTMTYDSLSKKRSMTDPDMGYWTYDYDKSGNLEYQTDTKGQTIRSRYDGLNRIYEKWYGYPTATSKVYFTYDDPSVPYCKGKQTKVSYQPSGQDLREDSVLEYDLLQRVKKSKKKIGTNEVTFEKSYDTAGKVIGIKYLSGTPNEKVYTYEYDVAGDLLYIKDNATGNHLVDYSDFTAIGQQKIATFPKPNNVSIKSTYTYDPPTARLKTLVTQKLVGGTPTDTFQDLNYQLFDGKGNVITLIDNLNAITHNYTYDSLDRLLTANGVGTNPYSQSFQYDRIGNITYKSDVGNYSYNYSNKPHAVNSAGSFSFQYDANGNMTQRTGGGDTITISATNWNYENKPTVIQKGSNTTTLTYDGNGQRVKKVSSLSGTTLYYGEVYEVRAGAGAIHLFAGAKRVASVLADGRIQFYHTDHLGSASVITDSDGNRKEQIVYFPFGTYRASGNINGTYDYDTNFPDVFYTFTGQEDDDDLGFYNYGARLYDPLLGRFISPDIVGPEIEDPQTFNHYTYVRNNPLIRIDPTGLFDIKTGLIQPGDTLTSIRNQINLYYRTTLGVNQIAASNSITNPNLIYAGHSIKLPYANVDVQQLNYGVLVVTDRTYNFSTGRFSALGPETVTYPRNATYNTIDYNFLPDEYDRQFNRANLAPMSLGRIFTQSVGGDLDFKNYLPQNTVFRYGDTLLNANEAANFIWPGFLASHGYGWEFSGTLPEVGSMRDYVIGSRKNYFWDEPWDRQARQAGLDYYYERTQPDQSIDWLWY